MPRQERQHSATGIYHVMLKGINRHDIFDGGYAKAERISSTAYGYTLFYYNQDHLGNIREVMNASGSLQQKTNYYPFGAEFCDGTANSSVQSHKYNGKELDLMHGLNTYDYGARQYFSILGRWDRIDPLCEKYYSLSPYNYCGNNPIRMIDIKGLEPGDFFKTKDEAAKDFGLFYNDNSIRENKEYASSIYKITDNNGNIWYSYSYPSIGKEDESFVSNAPYGTTWVATIHSHAAFSNGKYRDNEFSGIRNDNGDFLSKEERAAERGANDIGNANRRKMDSYVVTPNGSLLKYNYKENTITSISNYMPYDPTDGTSLTDNKNNAFYELNPTTVSDDLRMLRKVFYHNPNNP